MGREELEAAGEGGRAVTFHGRTSPKRAVYVPISEAMRGGVGPTSGSPCSQERYISRDGFLSTTSTTQLKHHQHRHVRLQILRCQSSSSPLCTPPPSVSPPVPRRSTVAPADPSSRQERQAQGLCDRVSIPFLAYLVRLPIIGGLLGDVRTEAAG
jgi:hypothetical protein